MNKKCVVVFTEGETEEAFYSSLLEQIKKEYGIKKFCADEFIKYCLKGISKFDKKLLSIYQNNIAVKYRNYDIVVLLCYDTDVFAQEQTPPVNWQNVEKVLLKSGAKKVYHVKAEKCIEDIFLQDIDGIVKFLKISKPKKILGKNGVEKLEFLFSKANRLYQKGFATKKFVESLNLSLLLKNNLKTFEPFILELLEKNM